LSVAGASNDWIELLEGMLPDILRLVVDTWAGMQRPFADNREDPITQLLCTALRRNRDIRDLPFLIDKGAKRPGGSEYVVNGMARFVSGQYARAVRHGGMLGYVLDGDIAGAIANVESNVQSKHLALCMDPPDLFVDAQPPPG